MEHSSGAHVFTLLGTDPKRLLAMLPTYHARAPNAHAFLFLYHMQGDIRQAIELAAALNVPVS